MLRGLPSISSFCSIKRMKSSYLSRGDVFRSTEESHAQGLPSISSLLLHQRMKSSYLSRGDVFRSAEGVSCVMPLLHQVDEILVILHPTLHHIL